MNAIDNWLQYYGQKLENIRNPVIYWAAVLMIVVGFSGLLWNLPVPAEFIEISPFFNWGSAFLMVAAVYYFIISLSLAIGLLPFLVGLAAFQVWLKGSGFPAPSVSGALLGIGTVGMFLGRGSSLRAIVEDIQLAMIAPAWVLSLVYRRFGIPI